MFYVTRLVKGFILKELRVQCHAGASNHVITNCSLLMSVCSSHNALEYQMGHLSKMVAVGIENISKYSCLDLLSHLNQLSNYLNEMI